MKRTIVLLMLMVLTGSLFAQVDLEKYYQGYYINRKGDKIEGLIKYERGYKRIAYKETADAKKTRYVTPYNCLEFVFDSATRFVRCPRSMLVRYGGWNTTVTDDFLHVFAEGKLNLYKHYSELASQNKNDFTPIKVESVVIRKEKGEMVALTGNENKDMERLEALFPNERDVVKALMGKNWEETVKFVRAYNAK